MRAGLLSSLASGISLSVISQTILYLTNHSTRMAGLHPGVLIGPHRSVGVLHLVYEAIDELF